MSAPPWYAPGLNFSCTGCGRCCTVPGDVWVTQAEIEAMAENLEMPVRRFVHLFVRRLNGRWSLAERNGTECVFWRAEGGCQVYETRPRQCRTFPFWQGNLASSGAWSAVALDCEGVGQGRLYAIGEIRRIVGGLLATDDGPGPPAGEPEQDDA